jgi:Tn7-like transposition protein D/TniQ
MIGHFPSPFPDELLYSVCARYSKRVKYPNNKSLCEELFGNRNTKAVYDLPCNLLALTNRLPINTCYSTEKIINNLTLLPYYSPFNSLEKISKTVEQMTFSNGTGVHSRIGLMATKVILPTYLRFCKICLESDLILEGESYWHRSHQLPGAYYCWKHHELLIESNVKIVGAENIQLFQPLDTTTKFSSFAESDNELKNKLIKIANVSNKLLFGNYSPLKKAELSEKYKVLLIGKGLVSNTKSLYVHKIIEEFLNFYPAEFLEQLGCGFSGFTGNNIYEDNWLLRILRKPTTLQHPLHHILLIEFLGLTLDEIIQMKFEENLFFGNSPWLCLNPTANHFKQRVIKELTIGKRSRNKKITGHFKCKCGFEYIRSGPDKSENDSFRIDKMVNFGTTWESRLVELWNNQSLNLSQIAKQLNVDSLTIKKYAVKLNLSFLRGDKVYKGLIKENCLKEKTVKIDSKQLIDRKRTEWLALRRENFQLNLKSLRENNKSLYYQLYQNDYQWLKNNLPKKNTKQSNKAKDFVDWYNRDIVISESLILASERIRLRQNPFKQITITSLGKETGFLSFLLTKLHKLPKTSKILKTLIESIETYAIRKIKGVADLFRQNKESYSKSKLLMKSGFYKLRSNPIIDKTINQEVEDQHLV